MEKIKDVIKKIAVTILLFFTTVYTKVLAYERIMPQPLYGVDPPEAETEPIIVSAWKILRWTLIPIAFIIGAIIYFKKSKSSTTKKVIIILIALVILVLAWLGIDLAIKQFE